MDNVTLENDIKSSMPFGGYDSKIFLKPINPDFNCIICKRKKYFQFYLLSA